jgi:hypothetical protein
VDRDGNRYIGGHFSHVILKSSHAKDDRCDSDEADDCGHDHSHRGIPARNLVKLRPDNTIDYDFLNRVKGADHTVRAISIAGNVIYVGGDFDKIGSIRANHIAKLDPSGVVDPVFNPPCGPNGTDRSVYALVATSSGVYAGGEFSTYRGDHSRKLVKIDVNGNQDPDFQSSCNENNGAVHALALNSSANALYVGGDFSKFGNAKISSLVQVNALTGALNSQFKPNGIARDVLALAVDPSGRIYVGGSGPQCQQQRQNALVRILASGASDSDFKALVDGDIHAIAVDGSGSKVYAGGTFRIVNGKNVYGIALLDPSGNVSTVFSPQSGAVGVGEGLGYRSHPEVDALALEPQDELIGGAFSHYRDDAVYDYAQIGLDGKLE